MNVLFDFGVRWKSPSMYQNSFYFDSESHKDLLSSTPLLIANPLLAHREMFTSELQILLPIVSRDVVFAGTDVVTNRVADR